MAKRSMTVSEWWNDNGIYCIIIGCFIGLLLFYFFGSNDKNVNTEEIYQFFANGKDYSQRKRRGPFESKGELICKDVATRLFNKPFRKIRPNFLKNEKTGNNLEIDVYNDDLKLGIEYSGRQHYEYVPHFHKDINAFLEQKYRDEVKEKKCKENGINLIIVPYTVKHKDIEHFIYKEAKSLGYQV
jgi:hypothetical protein